MVFRIMLAAKLRQPPWMAAASVPWRLQIKMGRQSAVKMAQTVLVRVV